MLPFKIGDKTFESRLFLGTGKFGSNQQMEEAILASGSELVTVALKRIDLETETDAILAHLKHPRINLLPNTSGARNAKEAIFAAQLAREALETNWLKLEIHPDPKYLLPDAIETLKATEASQIRIYRFALHSCGSGFMQTFGRCRNCSGNAFGLANWKQQRIKNYRFFRNHYRTK